MAWRDVLQQALGEHREAILAFTQDLIRIPSENPPGVAYRECIGRVEQELDRLGLTHELVEVPGFPEHPRYNLLSFVGEGDRTLYFHGHYDVVPAQRRDQFEPQVKNGVLFGRGSSDMKSGLAVMIYAAYLLKKVERPWMAGSACAWWPMKRPAARAVPATWRIQACWAGAASPWSPPNPPAA